MLGLALFEVPVHWSMTVPLLLVGLGHGLLVPPTLAGTVGQIPALAGSAAAVAGLMQQVMGAAGSYSVGAFDPVSVALLAALMLGFSLLALASQWGLHRAQSRARAGG
jgi:DHA1 family bicyclomycin/chloramphenicol resistance-like MFS transporter